VSGDTKAIRNFQSFLSKNDVISRVLNADRGFHSPLIRNALEDIENALQKTEIYEPSIPIALNATGSVCAKGEKLTTKLFLEQARKPVYFAKALSEIKQQFYDGVCIEIGPNRTLSSMARAMNFNTIALLPERKSTEIDVITGIESLWTFGLLTNGFSVNKNGRGTHLPTYPFKRDEFISPEAKAGIFETNRDTNTKLDSITIDKKNVDESLDAYQNIITQLLKLWEELLKCSKVSETDNFFDLGGDSLTTVSLIRKVNQIFDITVPPRKMLSAHTPSNQAKIIQKLLLEKQQAI